MKQKIVQHIIITFLVHLTQFTIYSQNLEKIGQKDALKISGGISTNQMTYFTTDSNSYQRPYTWVIAGNVNFNIYEWNIPFSYTISNYNRSFQQPFNRYSMHPSYKWIKAHLGNCQMNFSPYSLNGHQFLGAGVELNPGNLKVSAMFGRLKKPIEPDTSRKEISPSFKRMGTALQIGYRLTNQNIEIGMFKSWDIKNSVENTYIDSSLRPMENVVLTISGNTKILKKITLSAEIAGSNLTTDVRMPYSDQSNIYNVLKLTRNRSSTSIYQAYKSQISYSFKTASIGLNFEHVDPGYQTLGAYYNNNDFENYTITTSINALQNKISINANSGIQYDNLDNKKTSKNQRTVTSINMNIALKEQITLLAGYSNFTSFVNIRSPFEDINQPGPIYYIDTLKFTQISESFNTGINFRWGNKTNTEQNLNIMGNYMNTKNERTNDNSSSNIYNSSLIHSINFKNLEMSISTIINFSLNQIDDNQSLAIGPTLSINKTLFNKTLNTSLSISQNTSYENNRKQASNFIIRYNAGYKWQKNHTFSLTLVWMNRKFFQRQPYKSISDLTGTFNYNYSF